MKLIFYRLKTCFNEFTAMIELSFSPQIINAFLALLKLQENQGRSKVFILPSYTGTLWSSGSLEHWLFKKVI